jgi:hypothetical protein
VVEAGVGEVLVPRTFQPLENLLRLVYNVPGRGDMIGHGLGHGLIIAPASKDVAVILAAP